ncbi:1,2-phenylacetyl-CoA epoxidase subunit PaaC [Ectobacillus polymachus]|uniref:1,2-phenylacetyl-CoA epoxidase subunit PaaC n=1 Tax=Ectobacillus polymachus TaxID=1508806 RepID=UPI003A83D73A
MINTTQIQDPVYKAALVDLLFQLADDDFIFAYRGSEWLGLAPHIEEDVAFSSINQDTMGHASLYYRLLEELGVGEMDALAHGRAASERKNSILVELANGSGHYMKDPDYDWAFTVVRNYFYTTAKKIKINSLQTSSYPPLSEAAIKINTELYYHLIHWKTWFTQLLNSTEEARIRMLQAIEKVWANFGDMFLLGPNQEDIEAFGFIESETILKERFIAEVKPIFDFVQIVFPTNFAELNRNGRNGVHTQDLEDAIRILAEVYNANPEACW